MDLFSQYIQGKMRLRAPLLTFSGLEEHSRDSFIFYKIPVHRELREFGVSLIAD